MAEGPYYTPGQSDGVPPESPTEFSPQKPAGPDPVSPSPLPEGSEEARHAQLFAFDSGSGQFKPIGIDGDRLKVDAQVDITIGDKPLPVAITLLLPIQAMITRDPVTGLVSQIVENDGQRTKTTTLSRDAALRVSAIAEVVS
jgi:hypothetical protein